MARTLYLVKSSDRLVSYCRCETAFVADSAQLDCPWCGCGWLFTCQDCRKAFTFARATYVPYTLKQLAVRDLGRNGRRSVDKADLEMWTTVMRVMLDDLRPGQEYVYFDGNYYSTRCRTVRDEGIFASHDLSMLPHTAALNDDAVIREVLRNKAYWLSRRHEVID